MQDLNINDLVELRDAVKAGDGAKVKQVSMRLYPSSDPDKVSADAAYIMSSYTGDLGAAQRNHEKWLPDLPTSMTDMTPENCGGHGWHIKVNWPHMEWRDTFTAYPPDQYSFEAYEQKASRAWLRADLKALIAIATHSSKQDND
jgi:hypothetical protein